MTSRPVFERPRLMRTLLCLLIGVLALLWRAVPSFSWYPSWCVSKDTHRMEFGDVAYWGGSVMGCGMLACDRWRLLVSYDGWRTSRELGLYYDPYGYYASLRFQTFTTGRTHEVAHTYEFGVSIFGFTHRNKTSGAVYPHYTNCWTTVREMLGGCLDMTRDS